MKRPTPGRILRYGGQCLRLKGYLKAPGDGRVRPQIPAQSLLCSILAGQLLREFSFHAIEWLVRSRARRALSVSCRFGDDALGYFTERLDPEPTRAALAQVMRQAKRNKTFQQSRFIGLAIDGTGAGRTRQAPCVLCHPRRDSQGEGVDSLHYFCLISVVGTGLTLPLDIEPYASGDSEQRAGERLLRRAVGRIGSRYAQYVVVDSGFANAPFLHTCNQAGLKVVARLKGNLPELSTAAQARFSGQPAHSSFQHEGETIQLWDADDFDPWEKLNWKTVRVLRYLQQKPDGTVVEAYWLTDFPSQQVGSQSLYRMAKSRWEIENQGFNDAKNRYGLEHTRRHHANSLLVCWLLIILAIAIERLYRLRYLHRGTHRLLTAMELVRLLRLFLGAPSKPLDTS